MKDFPYHRLASRSWTEPFQSCLNYGSFGSFSVSLDSVDSNNMLKLKCFSSIETSFAMQTCKIFEGHRKCDYKKGRVKRPFSSFMQIQNLLIFYHFFFASFRKICNCITELAFVINMQFNNVFIKSTYYILQIANHSSFPLLQIWFHLYEITQRPFISIHCTVWIYNIYEANLLTLKFGRIEFSWW